VSDFTLFRLTLGLTEEGLQHIDDIVAIVYRYLSLMIATPPQKYIQVSHHTYICSVMYSSLPLLEVLLLLLLLLQSVILLLLRLPLHCYCNYLQYHCC
jgi:secreted Zn-dependent insulinase-like peptidase